MSWYLEGLKYAGSILAGGFVTQLLNRWFRRRGRIAVTGRYYHRHGTTGGHLRSLTHYADLRIVSHADQARSLHKMRFRFKRGRRIIAEYRMVRLNFEVVDCVDLVPHQTTSLSDISAEGKGQAPDASELERVLASDAVYLAAVDTTTDKECEWLISSELEWSDARAELRRRIAGDRPPASPS